ncbi:hypothetical protein ASPZODRAFT_19093 [Penicilliopsis zonata CBS 506.65]|uniref:LRR-containing protein second PH domain-containing protein n=1 Tax=Penicilliopsis zonata CBS 506.65 TaxID=1073090 RepID=A0A1L9S9I5_9EURO|nr:hypothetical protein ASPZODRAFT_19093 [Penicilliopsis zonata CBS 506.65]OJJ43789.1 hypothetical protein ASPZODRAFT_19093 [Penicilliopsis zonata CBS 506.65]
MAEKPTRKERRKSLSVFGASTTSVPARPAVHPAAVHSRSPSDDYQVLKKKGRRNSGFFGSRNPSPVRAAPPHHQSSAPNSNPAVTGATSSSATSAATSSAAVNDAISSPSLASGSFAVPDGIGTRPRRKSVQKKRGSMFGSFRSLHSLEDDEKSLGRSRGSSGDDDDHRAGIGSFILHYGEVQTTGGMWRKKSQYLVLTDTHLVRFKNYSKAAETFPFIAASYGRNQPGSRQSIASVVSSHDPQLSAYSDSLSGIPLNSIIAVYMLDDGRLSSTVEVAYLDERMQKAALIQMQTSDLQDLNLWMVGIRSAAEMARSVDPLPFDPRSVEYVARMLEYERDYDPDTFRMFRVIQMASSKSMARSSSDDLTKLSPTGFYLAVGMHKVHLLPMQKVANRASIASLNDLEMGTSFGLMTLTSLSMEWGDDSLHLTFRLPLRKPFSIFIASVHSAEVAFWLRQHTEYLRPLWIRQPYDFIVPRGLDNENNFLPVELDEDYGCFDRTLVAYSASYEIDTSNIRYTIDMQCEDAPCFKLLPPASKRRQRYTALELIAVFRSLRYNESFRGISFSRVNLDALEGLHDSYGSDIDANLSRAESRISIPGQENLSILSQEIRALALKSKWLRRLDFSYCLSRTPTLNGGSRDPGCGIPEAIFPVCRRELTSVDWVVLNGIKLGDTDLDYMVDAASQRGSHFRAVEVGNCGLSVHDLDLFLSTMAAQESTLESINISGVQGRLSPDVLQQHIGYFGHITTLDLSRISRTSGPEPLITAETLFNWRLQELSLSHTAVNRNTVDALATYLASNNSRGLRMVRLNQCGLTGEDVATFLYAMAHEVGCARQLHLYVNENRLDSGCSPLFEAIAQNKTPASLSMRMIDFKKEEHFRELVEALRVNRTLRYLDISKASLPYDAGPETCKSLQLMFEENKTLEDLDISGESAHLDVARFGIGLNLALTGLKKNKSLKVLRIEHQKLGLQGANTLASVLEDNTCLREVYCENNDINLQSFTVLVNGLQRNRSLLSLSCMDRDRVQSLEKVRREIESVNRDAHQSQHSTANSFRRSFHAAISVGHGNKLSKVPSASMHSRSATSSSAALAPAPSSSFQSSSSPSSLSSSSSPYADHNVEVVMKSLNQKWDAEVARLRRYLYRNYHIAEGVHDNFQDGTHDHDDTTSDSRPTTAKSLTTMLDNLKLEVTVSEREIHSGSEKLHQPQLSIVAEDNHPQYDNSVLEMFQGLDIDQPRSPVGVGLRPQTAPFSLSEGYSHQEPSSSAFYSECAPPSTSSGRLALPISTLPRAGSKKASSVRSAQSSSTLSTSTGSRSAYAATSSTLRGLLSRTTSKEQKKLEKSKTAQIYVSHERPPQLDWTPPKVDL